MTPSVTPPAPLWPLLLYLILVVLLAGAILAISYFLGERQHAQSTGVPYESGIVPTGSARVRFPRNIISSPCFSSFSTWKRPSSSPGR